MTDYQAALLGGGIIGVATSSLLLFNGRVTGISGIVGSALSKNFSENLWRYIFLIGLISGGAFMKVFFPEYFSYEFNFSYFKTIIAGLFVGIGPRLGSGCTSGHGVCGLPRLSIRSLVATLTFMFFGILTVYIEGIR